MALKGSLMFLGKHSSAALRGHPALAYRMAVSGPMLVSQRDKSGGSTPINVGVMFVPQQEAWVVERMGKYNKILEPGLNFLIPILDKVKYVQSLKEIAIDIPQQSAISMDNVAINIDGVLYLRIMDPYKASYGIEDPEFAITQLAQTTMRSEIGKISLDGLFKERENLNIQIVQAINVASEAWGIQCMRYEIRDIKLPERIQEAMQMQVCMRKVSGYVLAMNFYLRWRRRGRREQPCWSPRVSRLPRSILLRVKSRLPSFPPRQRRPS